MPLPAYDGVRFDGKAQCGPLPAYHVALRALRHLAHVLGAAPVGIKQEGGNYGKEYGDAAQAALPQMFYRGDKGTNEAPRLHLTFRPAGEQWNDLPYVDLQF